VLTFPWTHAGAAPKLVVPVRASRLRGRQVPATGSVGGDDPLEAGGDALGWFPATEVLVALPPAEGSYRLEPGSVAP